MRDIVHDIQQKIHLGDPVIFGFFIAFAISGIARVIEWLVAGLRWVSRPAARALGLTRFPPDDVDRLQRRRMFADAAIGRLHRVPDQDDEHRRFAELEAEIELDSTHASGLRRVRHLGQLTRRELSLTAAIERLGLAKPRPPRPGLLGRWVLGPRRTIVFLHGEPGSGKSVALRRVTRNLADRVYRNPEGGVIPLYVNLDSLAPVGDAITAGDIRAYVLATLTPGVEPSEDLTAEFANGMLKGDWLFLFDSLDEIPAVLGSSQYDDQVDAYAQALQSFLEASPNACSAVVASRHFRAPPGYGWPTLTIRSLSPWRQERLVAAALPNKSDQATCIDGLEHNPRGPGTPPANPLFLGMLCDYVHRRQGFPERSEVVVEDHLAALLDRGRDRVETGGIDPALLRQFAEELAFAMTGWRGGLTAPRQDLIARRRELGFPADARLPQVMNMLEVVGIAQRSIHAIASDEERPFKFRHRRSQEHLSACFVRARPDRVASDELLLGRPWRDVTVTLLETSGDLAGPLVDRAGEILAAAAPAHSAPLDADARPTTAPGEYTWDEGVLHLLALLQDAFRSRPGDLPSAVREPASRILLEAYASGRILHQWRALEVAGVAAREHLTALVRAGFTSDSAWLRDAAYRQVGRLETIPSDIGAAIRRALLGLGRLWISRDERATHEAQLSRVVDSALYLAAARQVVTGARINAVAHAAYVGLVIAAAYDAPLSVLVNVALAVASGLAYYDLAGNLAARDIRRPSAPPRFREAMRMLRQTWSPGVAAARGAVGRGFRAKGAGPRGGRAPVRGRAVARLCARGILTAVLIVLVAAGVGVADWWWTGAWAVVLLGVVWPLAALVAVSRGEYLGGTRQLLAPLTFVRATRDWVRSVPTWIFVFVGAGTVVMVVSLALLTQVRAGKTVTIVGYAVSGALLGVAVLTASVVYARRWLSDWRAYREWRDTRRDEVTIDVFVRVLRGQRTVSGLLRIMATARRRRLLEKVRDASDLLFDLEDLATAELPDDDVGSVGLAAMCRCSATRAWAAENDGLQLRVLRAAGFRFIDEVGRLMSQHAPEVRPVREPPVAAGAGTVDG